MQLFTYTLNYMVCVLIMKIFGPTRLEELFDYCVYLSIYLVSYSCSSLTGVTLISIAAYSKNDRSQDSGQAYIYAVNIILHNEM